MEDYIHLLSKPAYYLKIQNEMWQMRCTKWNPWWKVDEETPIAIAWISFQDLPPNFFGREFVFSLARAVGRPLHVDLATQNGTRSSCAKVKVEVNLMANLPQRIKIVEEEDETGPEEFKWIKIRYDYMPKYCKSCKKQGHKEEECWVINPELRRFEEPNNEVKEQGKGREVLVTSKEIGTDANSTRVLSSGRVFGKSIPNQAKQEWMQARKNKYQRDKRGHIIDDKAGKDADKGKGKNKVEEVTMKNKFDKLEVEEIQNPPLQITEGKGEDHDNGKKKEQVQKKTRELQEKVREAKNVEATSKLNPTRAGVVQKELIRVKKEAVEKALIGDNPSSSNTPPSKSIGDLEVVDPNTNKESTIEWVHR
uniref:DUF4283 domain-containing protein n=1 Tax=Nicotiana tabacum TaxID=4097 RepID=A0A1S3Y8I6_TOBAC